MIRSVKETDNFFFNENLSQSNDDKESIEQDIIEIT